MLNSTNNLILEPRYSVISRFSTMAKFLYNCIAVLILASSSCGNSAEVPECPPEGTVTFPDPESCSSYYVCTLGYLNHFDCPVGTHWNQEAGYCDLPGNVDCDIGRTTTAEPVPVPDCPTIDEISYLPYPGNCSLYFICYDSGQSYTVESCADDLLFDPIQQTCNLPELVDCDAVPPTVTTVAPTTVKPTPPTGDYPCPPDFALIYMPHPEVCTLFYACQSGEFDGIFNCGTGLWFSFGHQACVTPLESDCDKEPIPVTDPVPK